MRFSEHFGIAPTLSDDWFDPLLNQDTPLYVDPFLVFDDEDPLWTGARAEVIRFFETVLLRILKSDGIRGSASWNQAAGLLRCPEPNEFALGLSVGDPRGAGVGSQTAERIATVLDLLRSAGATELSSISGFSIFVDGMGPDLISDALCNILMSRFITYTQRVARSSGLPTQPIRVRNAAFDHAHERWLTKTVELPHNPFQNSAVLLTPKRFLQDLPPPDLTDFWDWGDSLGEELRRSLNVLAADDLSASQKIALARAWLMGATNPDLAVAFIRQFNSTHKASAYDVDNDPKGIVRWFEQGSELANDVAPRTVSTEKDIPGFVYQLAVDFKEEVEQRTGWKLLWDASKEKHQKEEVAQALAGAMWRSQCKAANVDVSKEVNVGRGPVDFKFSQGWSARALLELKHIGSTGFFTGAEKQVPQYLASENIEHAVYVAIGYTDRDFEPSRIQRVRDTCDALQDQLGVSVRLVIIDARPSTKTSASKQR